MDEKRYRESRLCRLLGNPIVYQMIVLLEVGGPMTPSKLAKLIGHHVSTISSHLAKQERRRRALRYLRERGPLLAKA